MRLHFCGEKKHIQRNIQTNFHDFSSKSAWNKGFQLGLSPEMGRDNFFLKKVFGRFGSTRCPIFCSYSEQCRPGRTEEKKFKLAKWDKTGRRFRSSSSSGFQSELLPIPDVCLILKFDTCHLDRFGCLVLKNVIKFDTEVVKTGVFECLK